MKLLKGPTHGYITKAVLTAKKESSSINDRIDTDWISV